LGEFFQNFNKPASPVTKLFNLSSTISPKPAVSHQSVFTELSRNKHCVLSREWADYSVEKATFNMNSFTESVHRPVGNCGERYTKITELGAGGFGRVYLAQDTNYREKVVLKEIELSKVRLVDIAEEIAILDRYPHHNIMRLLDHYSTITHYCMVYEFQSQVSLFEYLRLSGKQDELESKVILRQVVNALEWLHDNMIVHGDIKDENMIIQSRTRNIILIDFGSARIIKDKYEPIPFRGTRVYSPPEAVVGDVAFGLSLDVWTVGTFVYVLMNNRRPFVDDQEILHTCLPYPKCWSEGAKDFMRQCLNRDYLHRPTIKLLKYHPWIQS
jgi:serine/threonine protein kinase